MKKVITLIISLIAVLLLSVRVYADTDISKYFIYSPNDCSNPGTISQYVLDNGFNGAVADCRNENINDFIKLLGSSYFSYEHFILLDFDSFILNKEKILSSGLFSGIYIEYIDTDSIDSDIISDFNMPVGLYVPFSENILSDTNLDKNCFDSVIFENFYSSYSEYGYDKFIEDMRNAFVNKKTISCSNIGRVLSPVVSGDFFGDAFEISNQYLLCFANKTDFCVSDYSLLALNRYNSTDSLLSVMSSNLLENCADFKISNKFEITRPSVSSLTISTSSYSIYGTSDPSKPLYFGNEEVERLGETGLFVVNVSVPLKGKDFTFTQGNKKLTVFITRTPSSSGSSGTISNVRSMFPSSSELFRFGETFTVSCIAPGQANVSAEINGVKIHLEQVAYTDPGIPATYKAEVSVSDLGAINTDEVSLLGTVKYHLNFYGKKTDYESSGNIYIAGETARIAVKTTANLAGIEVEPIKAGNYVGTLRCGCTDYVSKITDGWARISCGGYLSKDHYEFITGTSIVKNTISSAIRDDGTNYGKLELKCSVIPAFIGKCEGNHLKVTLYNTDFINLSSSVLSSPMMFQIIFSDNGDGTINIDFYAHYNIWGWDVFTDEENGLFTIALKKPPVISDSQSEPLKGITVTVCAGHGGIDPGALSIAGENGVNEAQINRANALAIGESLENLGATVQYLICEKGKMDTYGRTDPAREIMTDLYICCHANSTAENADSNNYYGVASYYHFDSSSLFSKKMADYISMATKRDNNGSIQDYYSVTRLTICPSVMLEVGFVSNPFELESLINKNTIQKTAFAVTKAVLEICDN